MKRRARAARRPVLDVVSPHEALRMGPQCAQMADALHRQDAAASSSSVPREIIAPRVALHLPPPPPLLPPARGAETAPDAATLSALLSPRAQQQPQPPDSPPREMPRSGFYAASLDLDLDDLFAADGPPSPPPPVVVRQPLQRLRPQVEDVVVMLPQPTAFLAEPVVAVQIPLASPPLPPPKRVEVVEVEDSLPSAAVAAEGEKEEEEEDVVVVGSSQPPRIPLTKRRRNRDEDYVPPKRSKTRGNKAGKVEQLRSSPSPSPPPRPSQRRLRSNTRIDESGATASNPVDIDDSLHEDEGQAEAKASKDVFEFDDFCNEGDAQQKQHESRITLPPPLPPPSFSTPLPETTSTVQKPLVISAAGTPIIPAPRAITESSDEAVVLVYPPSDPWAVSLTAADVVRLDPDAHLNDSIIEFYLRYVEKELVPPDERGDYHFFNPFFYKKLTGGRSLSQGVLRWTRSLDVLSKRFLVVPINEHEHWSLAIIVLDQHAFDDIGCGILFFDSLGSTSSSTHSRRLRRWLSREWLLAEKKKMEKAASEGIEYQQPVEDSGGSGDHFNADVLPAKTLQLPLQQNYSDCGVFLLHYIELFVRQRPDAVSDFSRDWFPPEDIERKRAEVLDLIRCLATDDGKAVLAEVARHSEERHTQRRHSKRQQTATATTDVDAVEDEEVVMAEQIDDDDEDDDTERIAETPQ